MLTFNYNRDVRDMIDSALDYDPEPYHELDDDTFELLLAIDPDNR